MISALYNNIIVLSFLVIFLTTYSQLLLRIRINKLAEFLSFETINFESFFILSTDFGIISSLLAFFLSFICWSVAISNNLNVAKAYPIVSSLVILLVFFGNFLFFQDKLTPLNIFGGLFIVCGIFLLLK